MTTIIENRRNLHQIPEIELTTQKTAQYIENVLDLYDCIIDHPIQNSVTAYFDNQKEKTIVFRSDMDALPMEENTDLEFKSTNGCMHACGHDGHMAMVLELAKYAKESDAKEFIIGTENSIVQHLQYECPDKKFYPLSKDCVCHNMKLTTLMDVYNCVCGQGGEEIKLDENVRVKAKACIDTMLTLGE